MIVGDTRAVHPPLRSDVHIEEGAEDLSSSATMPEEWTNQLETRLSVEGQLLQMLASLQEQLDEQQVEAIHGREQATLERNTTTCVQNQLLTQIEILHRLESSGYLGGRVLKLHHHLCRQGLLAPRVNGSTTGHSLRVAVNTPRILGCLRSKRLPEWKT